MKENTKPTFQMKFASLTKVMGLTYDFVAYYTGISKASLLNAIRKSPKTMTSRELEKLHLFLFTFPFENNMSYALVDDTRNSLLKAVGKEIEKRTKKIKTANKNKKRVRI